MGNIGENRASRRDWKLFEMACNARTTLNWRLASDWIFTVDWKLGGRWRAKVTVFRETAGGGHLVLNSVCGQRLEEALGRLLVDLDGDILQGKARKIRRGLSLHR